MGWADPAIKTPLKRVYTRTKRNGLCSSFSRFSKLAYNSKPVRRERNTAKARVAVVANSQGLLSPCAQQRTGPPLARLALAGKKLLLWRAALELLLERELPQVGHHTHKDAIDILMRVPNRNPRIWPHCNVGGTALGQFERLAHLRQPFGRHVEFVREASLRRRTVRVVRSVRSSGARRRVADVITPGVALVAMPFRISLEAAAAAVVGVSRLEHRYPATSIHVGAESGPAWPSERRPRRPASVELIVASAVTVLSTRRMRCCGRRCLCWR